VSDFLTQFVSGSLKIPYAEYFNKVGLSYENDSTYDELSLGHINFSVNVSDSQLIIQSLDVMNKFGRNMGYEEGDVLAMFDGVRIDIDNYLAEFDKFKEIHKEGDLIKAVVLRADKKGRIKKVKLSARAISKTRHIKGGLFINPDANDAQIGLRKAWVGK
jgi:hypothetical protein